MKLLNQILLLAFASVLTLSCKKNKPVDPLPFQDISYELINRSVKASDVVPLTLDVNKDGTVDYSFFVELYANFAGDHLYAGVNPIGLNSTRTGDPDDDRFLNMAVTYASATGTQVNESLKANEYWNSDFGFLAVRNRPVSGADTHEGMWGDGQEHFLPIRLSIQGKYHYGWARLIFNKQTEFLTLVDCAWNKTPEAGIKAGER